MKQKKPRKAHLVRCSIGLFFATLLVVITLVLNVMAPGMPVPSAMSSTSCAMTVRPAFTVTVSTSG